MSFKIPKNGCHYHMEYQADCENCVERDGMSLKSHMSTFQPNDADKELREAIYGCAFAVETHPKDFVLRINQKGVQDLIAVIQADRQRTRQAVLDEVLEKLPEYSGDWSTFIGDKYNDERHRQKWFRIGWNQCRAELRQSITSIKGEEK